MNRGLAILEIAAALAIAILEAGLADGVSWGPRVRLYADGLVIVIFFARLVIAAIGNWREALAWHSVVAVVAAAAGAVFSIRLSAGVVLLHDALLLALWFRAQKPAERVLLEVGAHPARSLVQSFIGLIALGTLLLSLPAASVGERVGLVDAFFTAVSATCVTGLVTVDTATVWSPFGQGVILVLFQLGGLGIMAVAAAMTLAFGETLGAARGESLGDVFDESDAEELRTILKALVVSTFAIEALGAGLLFIRFAGEMPLQRAAATSVFHSVSAFCNAGFSLNSDSLVAYAADPLVNGVVVVLVVLGGLGFGVLVGLWRVLAQRRRQRLTLHVKLVLVTSAVLFWTGALFYFFFEYDRSLRPLGLGGKILASLFQSASTRTAGFNTVPLADLHPVTVLAMASLMFVGASPGSTGGGLKTTTLALVLLAARAFIYNREHVEVFGRRVSQVQVLRAMALFGGAILSLALGFGALLLTEELPFEKLLFEATSALGTVGLSMGITPQLSTPGRLVVCVLMFFGRVGPLTALAAIANRRGTPARITMPEGKVLVG